MENRNENRIDLPSFNHSAAEDEEGVIAVVIERMEEQHLPRAVDLKAKVDQGGRLDEMDIAFLDRVLTECNEMKPMLERHPELELLASSVMVLYHAITERALANEKAED